MNRAMKVANRHFNGIDLFCGYLESFRTLVYKHSGRLRGQDYYKLR